MMRRDDAAPELTKDTRVKISLGLLWGVLVCCVVATAFIVRLSAQIDTLTHQMVDLREETHDLRVQQVVLLRELDSIKRR